MTSPGKPELLSYFQPTARWRPCFASAARTATPTPLPRPATCPWTSATSTSPKGLGHAIRSVADAVAGESFLVLLGDYVVPSRDICTRMLEVSRAHAGASVIAVAPCSPADVSRYGVIAGERVDTLEGLGGVADDEPGAVWRVSGLVEKPAAEEALQPLHRGPLPALAAGHGPAGRPGARQGRGDPADRRHGRSLEREAMYAVVIDPLSGYDTGTPSGWIATNALMAAADPASPTSSGRPSTSAGIGPSLGGPRPNARS